MGEYVPGLEGVVAAETEISEVDGQGGRLIYRGGYLIQDLQELSYEEVGYLLLNGKLPDRKELEAFKAKLVAGRPMNEAARSALRGIPADADPMDALRTALSAQGARPGVPKPSLDDAIAFTAVTPTIVAAFYRQANRQEWVEPKPDLGHAANFLYMMTGKPPDPDQAGWLETYLVLLADHGLNASTSAARVIASTGTDLCSALVGAIGALKGPAHGGAATAAKRMVEKVGGVDNAEKFVTGTLDRHEKLMGFGHRVYRTYDPRARILRDLAKVANPEYYPVALKVEEVAIR